MTLAFQELRGNRAKAFANSRLELERVDYDTWYIYYRDPASGQRYVIDYPDAGYHGMGSPRLRPIEAVRGD